jgi:AraC family transcriptional activator of pobA
MTEVITISSIGQIHEMLGYDRPAHPLITLLESSREQKLEPEAPLLNVKIVTELYSVSLKNGTECGLKYGRQSYDFQAGSLMFMAPGQAMTPVTEPSDLESEEESWTLVFHPDLIRGTALAERMSEYCYFGYDSHEALHVSDAERDTVNDIVRRIQAEYRQNLDIYSRELIVSGLELMLNYCKRFYGRQFITRVHTHQDVVARFEAFLRDYGESGRLVQDGMPSVVLCGREMGFSPNYLSDLLRKETGRNTRDHIHHFVIEKAKDLLLASEEAVNQIAFSLGFEHPQHFSKLFKSKTGMTPTEFRS